MEEVVREWRRGRVEEGEEGRERGGRRMTDAQGIRNAHKPQYKKIIKLQPKLLASNESKTTYKT